MQTRSEIETELRALTEKAAQLADHMHRAAQALDTLTVTDCTHDLHRVEMQIDEACFRLDCVVDVERLTDA